VLLRGAKMSKSDQHFFLVEDVAKKVEPEVIRYYLQSRTTGADRVERGSPPRGWDRVRAAACRDRDRREGGRRWRDPREREAKGLHLDALKTEKLFEEAMEDDFNSAKAQGHLFDLAKAINRWPRAGPWMGSRGRCRSPRDPA